MDTEAELIRSERWRDLEQFYSKKAGYAWEQAWVSFLKTNDLETAARQFKLSFQDPRYEEASFIMLWKLGQKPKFRSFIGPSSLRLYEAYQQGEFGPLIRYAASKKSRLIYLDAFLERVLRKEAKVDAKDIEPLESLGPVSARASFLLGRLLDQRRFSHELVQRYYDRFLEDPWTNRVLRETREEILDDKTRIALQHAYKVRDRAQIKRLLTACESRINKIPSLSQSWANVLRSGIQWDLDQITQSLRGYPFWDHLELSPAALFKMRERMFAKQEKLTPPFFQIWEEFLATSKVDTLPLSLEPDSKPIWQIRVEMDRSALREALLRFPAEERFLFLWTLQQSQKGATTSSNLWPKDQKESKVVWENLVRAFKNASNPQLWFDRLRSCGCSQDFYEYALENVSLPIAWVLEDLDKKRIEASSAVRHYLKQALSITAPNDFESHELSEFQVLNALSLLTPAETQQVLVSRYVVKDLSPDIINIEVLDLLWDSRKLVSPETVIRWETKILEHLSSRGIKKLSSVEWRWVEAGWQREASYLKTFSPSFEPEVEFPWSSYLEAAAHHDQNLLLMALHRVPDERLKEDWVEILKDQVPATKLQPVIGSLKSSLRRSRLLADLYEKNGDIKKAVRHRFDELSETPILNEQIAISLHLLDLFQEIEVDPGDRDRIVKVIESLSNPDLATCRKIAQLFERSLKWEETWQWTKKEWERALPVKDEKRIDRLLEVAFMAQKVEACQRLLVDSIFSNGASDAFTYRVMDILLHEESIYHLKHLRSEFVEQAGRIFPLHRNLLRRRSQDDYRAVLLWRCFYKNALTKAAEMPARSAKRQFRLLGLTTTSAQRDEFQAFVNLFERYAPKDLKGCSAEGLEDSRRIANRLAKRFRQKKPEVSLSEDQSQPFRVYFEPFHLQVDKRFFHQMDEAAWTSFVVGSLQAKRDWEAGLYDKERLAERFFQGMLLSGVEIGPLIRFWIYIALSLQITEPKLLHTDPDELMYRLPFMNQLMIFYLSEDYREFVQDFGLPLH